jgi:hypothetical protein
MAAFRPPGDCPVCGADVPARSKACAGCGATADAGWNEDAATAGLDLPDQDDEFDYDEFLERELGQPRRKPPSPRRWLWIGLTVLLAAMIAATALGLWR